jgi:signal transduction histidine kinase/ActR/RegA family two-component response regulator
VITIKDATASGVRRYALAVACAAAATLIRVLLVPVIGLEVPFILFFPALLLSSWLGGLGPGALTTSLLTLAAWFFFMPPAWSFRLQSWRDAFLLALFFLIGLAMSGVAGALHRSRRRTELALHEVEERESALARTSAEARQSEEARESLLDGMEQALRQAEEASRSKDEFLATVSHELRTPLNSVMGWAELLLMAREDGEKLERGLRAIVRNAQLQKQLIEDLLDVSRIISGKMRLEVRPLEPAPVIEAALEAVRPAADAKQIRLRTLLDPQAGPVAGDPNRLQQVAWNLLSNAIKFTPKGGLVEVRLQRAQSQVEVLVTDSGIGIAPEFLPHVFDRFRQLDSSTTRAHGGLGLGLAIVRHLVELHGGTVEARSAGEGHGSMFVVRLPLALSLLADDSGEHHIDPRTDAARLGSDPELDLTGIRVLVVDDEADARETLVEILRRARAEVLAVASADAALEALESFRPDVLLSDIAMPERDGYSLIQQVRQLPAERGGGVPAVAVTAFARGEDRHRSLLAGFQSHLTKPIAMGELVTVVASLARRPSAPRPPSPPG